MRRSTATALALIGGGVTIAGLVGILALNTVPKRTALAASVSASAPTNGAPTLSETITFVPTPDDAVIELNGVVLGTGRQKIARPKPGATITVRVRAKKFEPMTFMADSNASEEMKIELVPSPEPAAPTETAAAKPPTQQPASQPKGGGSHPPDKGAGKQPAIPVNPY
jgi:hypothetical protein